MIFIYKMLKNDQVPLEIKEEETLNDNLDLDLKSQSIPKLTFDEYTTSWSVCSLIFFFIEEVKKKVGYKL